MSAEFITPRGMRDFLSSEMIMRKEMLAKIEAVFKKYGFDPVETPALEYLRVLGAKCGEEISGQIYRIEDMGMRFEFTAGLARMVANSSLPKPFKAYQIGPVWRRDEPQKGRARQFWQADADIIGSESMACEAELLACASEALRAIGIKGFIIRLNNIKTLNDILAKAGVKKELFTAAKRSLDKLKKKSKAEVKKEMEENRIGKEQIREIFKLIESKKKYFEGVDELEEIISLAKAYGIKNIKIDYSLARGLAYYTGPVFEFESKKDLGSIGGGGRYDDLLGLFGAPSPAVGISLGIYRLMELIRPKELKEKTIARVFIATIGEAYPYAIKISQKLREEGINASLNLTDRALRRQLDYANSIGVPFAIIIGEKEAREKFVTLRDLKTGKERKIKIEKAVKLLKAPFPTISRRE